MTTRVSRVFFVLLAACLLLAGPALAQQFNAKKVYSGVSTLITPDTEGGICFYGADSINSQKTGFVPKLQHLSRQGTLTTTVTIQDIKSIGSPYDFFVGQQYNNVRSIGCSGNGITWNMVANTKYRIGDNPYAALLKKTPNQPKELTLDTLQETKVSGKTLYAKGVQVLYSGYGRTEIWAYMAQNSSGQGTGGYLARVVGYNELQTIINFSEDRDGDLSYHLTLTKNATWLPTKVVASNYLKLYRIRLTGEKSLVLEGFTPAHEPILGTVSNSTSLIMQNLNKGEVEYVLLSEAGGAPQVFRGLPAAEFQALTESGVHYILTQEKKLYRRLPGQNKVDEVTGLSFKPFSIAASEDKVYLQEITSPVEGNIYELLEQATLPEFSVGNVVNGASFKTGISPGSIVTIFGKNLNPTKTSVSNTANPMTTTLNGVEVLVNGIPAPLFHVIGTDAGDQVTFQLPFEVYLDQVKIQVRTQTISGEQLSREVAIPVQKHSPAVFQFNDGTGNFGIFTNARYQIAGYQEVPRLKAGEIGIAWAMGLGQTQPSLLITGNAATAHETATKPKLTFSGKDAQILWSGAAEGFVGLYQINFVMPDVPEDAVRQGTISIGGYESSFDYL